jgi:hypothetical protein
MPDDFTLKLSFLTAAVLGVVSVSLFLGRYFRSDPMVRSLHLPFSVPLFLIDFTHPQLNAIPTIGLSDPILSYFSALQFSFDGVRMLKEGYEKVNFLALYVRFLEPNQ